MRRILKLLAMPALGGLVLLSGLTVAPDTADARRLGRSVAKSVAVGSAARAVTRSSYARDREDDQETSGNVKVVDHEARAREAKEKLAAEAAASTPFFVPAVSASALPVEERKAVCVAGCY